MKVNERVGGWMDGAVNFTVSYLHFLSVQVLLITLFSITVEPCAGHSNTCD
jgi:hypothetical protein